MRAGVRAFRYRYLPSPRQVWHKPSRGGWQGSKLKHRYWTVLKTKQASSADARKNVSRQDFEFYHPMCRTRPDHGVRRVLPLFPYYLLVKINLRKENWKSLRSTRGVTDLFLSGDRPSRVPDEVVQHFRDLENDLGYCEIPEHDAPRFQTRQSVRAINGLFTDCEGEYQGLAGPSHERVRVLFRFLGVPKVVEMKAFDLVAA
jgi:transcription antitermination factor NusG